MARKKILFIAEAVTLAHVGRPLALAQALDPQRFEIHFACSDGYDFCFKERDFIRWRLNSISSEQFLQALAAGKPVYDTPTLKKYVEDDRSLLQAAKPDFVLGDFRLSLSVSARLENVPYAALSNAYWSPYVRQHYTVPSLPLTRLLPIALANSLFRLVRPLAFAAHTGPLNHVRREYGLATLGRDLRRIYTDADYTLYADVPELFPGTQLPPNHSFLGPVIWSPPVPVPDWWGALRDDRPIVYVTLGSSGQGRLLPRVLQTLALMPLTVLAATAGNIKLDSISPHIYIAPFLPGEAVVRHAALVICNGGSPTSQQALAAGVPVLGIAGNLDQFLNMHGIVAAGAGALLRADRFSAADLEQAVNTLLHNNEARDQARKIGQTFARYHAGQRFTALLDRVLGTT